jgi:hypothetical protein
MGQSPFLNLMGQSPFLRLADLCKRLWRLDYPLDSLDSLDYGDTKTEIPTCIHI